MLRIARYPTVLALVLSLGAAGLVLWGRELLVMQQRQDRLQLETQAMASLVESVSNKGVVMSGAALIGVFDVRAKLMLSSLGAATDLKALADLATVIELLHVRSAALLNGYGVVQAELDARGTMGIVDADQSQKPHVRGALAGASMVHLEVDAATGQPTLHFAAPIYEERSTSSRVVGVYHLATDATDIQRVLAGYLPRTALLVSPQGRVLAGNRPVQEVARLLQAEDPLQAGPAAFGQMEVRGWVASAKAGTLPWSVQGHLLSQAPLGWPSPEGPWRVVLLEPRFDAADAWSRLGLGLAVFGVLFGGYLLLARHNAAQRRVRQMLQARQHEQEASLRAYADQVDFQARLMDAIPTPLFVKDAEGRTAGMNRAYEEAYGMRREDCLGKTLMQVDMPHIPVDQRSRYFAEQLGIIAMGVRVHTKRDMRWMDGAIHHELYWGQGIRRSDGQPAGMVGVILDVSDTVQANIALQAAKEAAEEAGAAKSAFLANMSHEIRTPMNAIIGLSDLALKNDMPPRIRDYLGKIRQSGEHLLGIINDILDFSKIESGKLEFESVPFALDAVTDNLVNLVGAKAADKGLELILSVQADVPQTLVGDPLRIGQVLINLANNAVKFTTQGEVQISIRVVGRDGHGVVLRFDLADTGIGLSAEQIGRLFSSFEQADRSTTRKYGGTGLGLAISKRLVQAMGGEIGVESEPGQGSTFWFTAPLGVEPSAVPLPAPGAALQGRRVLVVDDNARAAQVLAGMLADWGMDAERAGSGEGAIACLAQPAPDARPFDLILLDWQMPGLDGPATLQAIRRHALGDAPCVLMVAAHRRLELLKGAQQIGVSQLLGKPVGRWQLLGTVLQALGCAGDPDAPSPQAVAVQPVEGQLAHLAGARVLLVEDNEINQQVASEILQSAGFVVDLAENGLVAVDRVQTRAAGRLPYDLVLMDMQMPVMDGCTAARRIRESHPAEVLPIVAMTANAMKDDRDRCMAAGMNAVVTKPIRTDDLWRAMLAWVRVREGMGGAVAAPARTPASDAARQWMQALRSVAELDVEQGLARTTGNPDFYAALLRKFVAAQEDAMLRLRQALENADRPTAERIAHTLKGVAANLGATVLPELAGRLEAAVRQGSPVAALEPVIHETVAALERLIGALQRTPGLLAPQPAARTDLQEDERETLAGVLAEIQGLLVQDDAQAAALWERHAPALHALLPQAAQVEAAIAAFDFEAALRLLAQPAAVS